MFKKLIVVTALLAAVLVMKVTPWERSVSEVNTGETLPLYLPPISPISISDVPLAPHPRLFVTSKSLADVREKLASPIYAGDVEMLRKSMNPTDQALSYLIWNDKTAGRNAKNALLSDKKMPRYGGLEGAIMLVQLAVMYDWLHPLLNADEKQRVQQAIKNALAPTKARRVKEGVQYYLNDHWGRGLAFETIAVLALAGEVEWANDQLLNIYTDSKNVFSPYQGGAVDTLRTLALESGGGNQVGHDSNPGTGYDSMFLIGASLFSIAWETATGEELWSKSNYFEKLPNYLTYGFLHVAAPGDATRQVLEYSVGRNSANSSALSQWLLNKYGRAKYALAFRLLIGDLRKNEARSPQDLDMPLSTYLDGADLLVSRTGWNEQDTAVFMFARHWDTARYEPASGIISIYKDNKPILVRGIVGKSGYRVTNNSGVWIWNRKEGIFQTWAQGSTYWNELNNLGRKTRRAFNAGVVLSGQDMAYRPQTLISFEQTAKGAVSAVTRYEKLMAVSGVEKVTRSIIHSGKKVLINDEIVIDSDLDVAVGFRLVEEPIIKDNRVSTSSFEMTVASNPASRIRWSGGEGKELIGPTGEWHGSRKGGFVDGYAKDPKKVSRYGLGYLFIEPVTQSEHYTFTTEIIMH